MRMMRLQWPGSRYNLVSPWACGSPGVVLGSAPENRRMLEAAIRLGGSKAVELSSLEACSCLERLEALVVALALDAAWALEARTGPEGPKIALALEELVVSWPSKGSKSHWRSKKDLFHESKHSQNLLGPSDTSYVRARGVLLAGGQSCRSESRECA